MKYGRSTIEHGRLQSKHWRSPIEHGRYPSKHWRSPIEHGSSPIKYGAFNQVSAGHTIEAHPDTGAPVAGEALPQPVGSAANQTRALSNGIKRESNTG